MIIIAIAIGVVFVLILGMIIKAYYNDIIELENRILQLEKRQVNDKKEIESEIKTKYLLLNNVDVYLDEKIKDIEGRTGKLERKRNIQKNS